MSTSAARLRLLGLALSVAIGSALAWVVIGGDLDTVQATVESTGAWGPVVYVALHVLPSGAASSPNVSIGLARIAKMKERMDAAHAASDAYLTALESP